MSIGKLVVVVRTDIRTHKPAVCRFAPRVEIRVGGDLVDTHGPGEIFGEMALIDSQARSASFTAKTDCRLVPVDERRFLFMVQQTPFFALNVMQVLADRLRLAVNAG